MVCGGLEGGHLLESGAVDLSTCRSGLGVDEGGTSSSLFSDDGASLTVAGACPEDGCPSLGRELGSWVVGAAVGAVASAATVGALERWAVTTPTRSEGGHNLGYLLEIKRRRRGRG